mgnify:CR=1 FL=1
MFRSAFLAGGLSLVIPGLGQMCAGRGERGAAILVTVIIVGNLNAIWLSLFAAAGPAPGAFWTSMLPRLLHDLFAVYGVVFWIWQVIDAYRICTARQDR